MIKKLSELVGKGIEITCKCGLKHLIKGECVAIGDLREWAKEVYDKLSKIDNMTYCLVHDCNHYSVKNCKCDNKKNCITLDEYDYERTDVLGAMKLLEWMFELDKE